MPSLAMFKGERNLDELVARLFPATTGRPQARKQATEALLKTNPQLADLGRLPAGSVIVVPDTPAAVNAGETVHPATFTPADFARLVNEHVTAFASALAAQSANAAAQADATLKLLNDRSLTAAASRDQELAQRLTTISENTKSALKDLQAQEATLQQDLAQLQKDLAKFTKASPPAPVPPGQRTPTLPVPQPPPVGPTRPPIPPTPLRAAPAKPPSPRRARTTKTKKKKK
jgi:phage tail protein X